jgi:hypothetical protein
MKASLAQKRAKVRFDFLSIQCCRKQITKETPEDKFQTFVMLIKTFVTLCQQGSHGISSDSPMKTKKIRVVLEQVLLIQKETSEISRKGF